MVRIFGLLERLFSVAVVVTCVVALFYTVTTVLSSHTTDPSYLQSRDTISLEQAHRAAAQQHQLGAGVAKGVAGVAKGGIGVAKARPAAPTSEFKPTVGEPADTGVAKGDTDDKYKTVGEGLQVPKGKDQNILFIKTHKCGTSSMVNLFYLYGIRRRLNFVINPWMRSLNLEQAVLPPRPGQDYNIQCAHCKFKPELQHMLLPKTRTFYTTIIRSPVKRFVSAFGYYGKDRTYNKKEEEEEEAVVEGKEEGRILPLDDTILRYLDEKVRKRGEHANTTCFVDYVLNGLARDLGFEVYLKRDGLLQAKIEDFVSDLAQEMDFVLLTDYFDESLVLLKEQMGWEYSDIFYMNRLYTVDRSRKDSSLSEETLERIMKYNIVDVQLYNYFHQLYKVKVRAFGEVLLREKTAEFRRLRAEFENRCYNKPEVEDKSVSFNKAWTLTEWGEQEKSCTLLHMRDIDLAHVISELQLKVDFTAPNEGELMEQYAAAGPIPPPYRDIVVDIQAAFVRGADV